LSALSESEIGKMHKLGKKSFGTKQASTPSGTFFFEKMQKAFALKGRQNRKQQN
jgi:hypothetical protein